MVHVRLNEKEANPNPHINFITPLKADDAAAEEEARQLLRALAAQVRPIMKAEGFVVNSFEEYEYNRVFAGRNWNNGEVVELVLRDSRGGFLPTSWLLSTLCHELAHIKHMNHGPAFQALWAKLRNEVRELQRKGYYGDGYWSSGTRLADSARLGSQGLEAIELPEFMCGGAQSRARPTAFRRRRRQQAGPSNHTGAQTAKRRKAGSRVTAQGTFKGSGRALNEDLTDEDAKKAGAGFRKKAGSKRAREERALAAERRLRALQGIASDKPAEPTVESDSEDDGYVEGPPETDQERRNGLLTSIDKGELDDLRTSRQTYLSEFFLPPASTAGPSSELSEPGGRGRSKGKTKELDTIELTDDDEPASESPACDVQALPKGGAVASTHPPMDDARPTSRSTFSRQKGSEAPVQGDSTSGKGKLSYGALVQDEIQTRRREALGLTGGGRRLGGRISGSEGPQSIPSTVQGSSSESSVHLSPAAAPLGQVASSAWSCQVCTLVNEPRHLACSACATPRGESTWSGNPV
ncbi:WLM-domain-containing protein [Trametes coccinea BRFM310]|uniref:WLM-domain-containing protein n=1 Tax=Trametes coccinea (strain BRFM310) TaxID=1353009 RepID=A0A1Y2J2B5_TRAC3|nr:WLM-domain-containing protein [Trametes coccinea BRFM310]